jgi:hypothetical protein
MEFKSSKMCLHWILIQGLRLCASAVNKFSYFDSFSVVGDVFHLGLRKLEPTDLMSAAVSAKRGIEAVDVDQTRKMRPTPVVVSSQTFEVCSAFYPPNLTFAPPFGAFLAADPSFDSFSTVLQVPAPAPVATLLPAHDAFLSTLAAHTPPKASITTRFHSI